MSDTVTAIGTALRTALDDVGLDLDPLLEHRLVDRVVELLALAGYELVHERAPHLDTCTNGWNTPDRRKGSLTNPTPTDHNEENRHV